MVDENTLRQIRAHQAEVNSRHLASEADRRARVETEITHCLVAYGANVGPHVMGRMVMDLRMVFDMLAIHGYLPTIEEAR